jgi:hypothetical protein
VLNNNQTRFDSCYNFYISVLSFNSTVAATLCRFDSEFGWHYNPTNYMGYFETAVYLVSTYLYPSENFVLKVPDTNEYYTPFAAFMTWTGFNNL